MKKKLSFVALLLASSVSAEQINDQIKDKKISDTTTVYANGITSTLLLAKFSDYTPIKINRSLQSRIDELEVMYLSSQISRTDSFDSEQAGMTQESSLLPDEYEEAMHEMKAQLESQLLVGDFEHNYYYTTANWELTAEQEAVLTAVLEASSEVEGVKIDIVGRADPRGDSTYNQELSEKRAGYIRELALASGFGDSRITATGLGEVGELTKDRELQFFNRYSTVRIYK
ncbi:exported hypothetical protein [Vibrio chagasii]|nr:exported hypothetical protein [Vibrio chagasii]